MTHCQTESKDPDGCGRISKKRLPITLCISSATPAVSHSSQEILQPPVRSVGRETKGSSSAPREFHGLILSECVNAA